MLEALILALTDIGDEGLEHLASIKSREELWIMGAKVSNVAVQTIRERQSLLRIVQ